LNLACVPASGIARAATQFIGVPQTDRTVAVPRTASGTVVWLLALAPLIALVLKSLIAQQTDIPFSQLWVVTALLNTTLCLADARLLKKEGHKPPNVWVVFLVPVYLFKRSNILGDNKAYFYVWLATFFLSLAGR